MKKIGISCKGVLKRYGTSGGFEILKRCGFDAVDFGLESYKLGSGIYAGSDDEFESHFDMVKRTAAKYELEISQTHGRCVPYKIDDEKYNSDSVEVSKLDLRATAALGAPSCVIHFPNSTRCGKQSPDFMHEASNNFFSQIVPSAEEYGVSIALETFGAARVQGDRIRDFFASPDEFLKQYERLDTKYKTICVDTGHTHEAESFWVPSPEEIIRIFGKRISILHLHDNSGHWDDHLIPGMGNINWPAVFDALDEVGYTGTYNFELALRFGSMLDEALPFLGKYLRAFVESRGNLE